MPRAFEGRQFHQRFIQEGYQEYLEADHESEQHRLRHLANFFNDRMGYDNPGKEFFNPNITITDWSERDHPQHYTVKDIQSHQNQERVQTLVNYWSQRLINVYDNPRQSDDHREDDDDNTINWVLLNLVQLRYALGHSLPIDNATAQRLYSIVLRANIGHNCSEVYRDKFGGVQVNSYMNVLHHNPKEPVRDNSQAMVAMLQYATDYEADPASWTAFNAKAYTKILELSFPRLADAKDGMAVYQKIVNEPPAFDADGLSCLFAFALKHKLTNMTDNEDFDVVFDRVESTLQLYSEYLHLERLSFDADIVHSIFDHLVQSQDPWDEITNRCQRLSDYSGYPVQYSAESARNKYENLVRDLVKGSVIASEDIASLKTFTTETWSESETSAAQVSILFETLFMQHLTNEDRRTLIQAYDSVFPGSSLLADNLPGLMTQHFSELLAFHAAEPARLSDVIDLVVELTGVDRTEFVRTLPVQAAFTEKATQLIGNLSPTGLQDCLDSAVTLTGVDAQVFEQALREGRLKDVCDNVLSAPYRFRTIVSEIEASERSFPVLGGLTEKYKNQPQTKIFERIHSLQAISQNEKNDLWRKGLIPLLAHLAPADRTRLFSQEDQAEPLLKFIQDVGMIDAPKLCTAYLRCLTAQASAEVDPKIITQLREAGIKVPEDPKGVRGPVKTILANMRKYLFEGKVSRSITSEIGEELLRVMVQSQSWNRIFSLVGLVSKWNSLVAAEPSRTQINPAWQETDLEVTVKQRVAATAEAQTSQDETLQLFLKTDIPQSVFTNLAEPLRLGGSVEHFQQWWSDSHERLLTELNRELTMTDLLLVQDDTTFATSVAALPAADSQKLIMLRAKFVTHPAMRQGIVSKRELMVRNIQLATELQSLKFSEMPEPQICTVLERIGQAALPNELKMNLLRGLSGLHLRLVARGGGKKDYEQAWINPHKSRPPVWIFWPILCHSMFRNTIYKKLRSQHILNILHLVRSCALR